MRRLSLHKYEEKRDGLKAEVEQVSASLSVIQQQDSEVRSATLALRKEHDILAKELAGGYKEVARLDEIISTHDSRLKHVKGQIEEKLALSDNKLREHEASLEALSLRIKEKIALIDEIDVTESQLTELRTNRDELMLEIGQLQGRRYDMEQYMEKEHEKLETEKIDVNQLIAKHGAILTHTEENLSKIELYVRRLQRYYDEHHINLNILPVFNIPKL